MIKHKGKLVSNTVFPEYVEGTLIQTVCGDYIVNPETFYTIDKTLITDEFSEVETKSVVRFTEKYDKNGTEIYERDVVRVPYDDGGFWTGIIAIKNGCVMAIAKHRSCSFLDKEKLNLEVINTVDGLEELMSLKTTI